MKLKWPATVTTVHEHGTDVAGNLSSSDGVQVFLLPEYAKDLARQAPNYDCQQPIVLQEENLWPQIHGWFQKRGPSSMYGE